VQNIDELTQHVLHVFLSVNRASLTMQLNADEYRWRVSLHYCVLTNGAGTLGNFCCGSINIHSTVWQKCLIFGQTFFIFFNRS